jgi:hypothetical protein
LARTERARRVTAVLDDEQPHSDRRSSCVHHPPPTES